jgi:hypothetical protein
MRVDLPTDWGSLGCACAPRRPSVLRRGHRYYNNGITIVCDHAEHISVGGRDVIRVSNPQIINGQQTTRTLHLFASASSPASVIVRTIEISRAGQQSAERISPHIRSQIPYGAESFRQLYRERTAVERVFSRLLTIAMQDLPTRGLDSARNLCTIAHITVLLAAMVAHRSGCSDQLAFVRTFLPNLIDMPPEKPVL